MYDKTKPETVTAVNYFASHKKRKAPALLADG
jgi:hypothetical protein